MDWMPSPFRQALQGTQDSFQNLGWRLQKLWNRQNGLGVLDVHALARSFNGHESHVHTYDQEGLVFQCLPSPSEDASRQLEVWRKGSHWTDKPAEVKVSVPKGTLCQLETNFQIGLPPDAVFDIIIDPENKRVFKSIKEVTYRKVHEDDGHRQLVEVEQAAIWRFLCFSGTMSIRVFVDQDRKAHTVKFHLAKEGFMKKFEGVWTLKPIYVDVPHCDHLSSPLDDPLCGSSRIASDVSLKQIVQPRLIPPPPISWYIRGITSKQIENLLEDLQAEGKRLREGNMDVQGVEQEQMRRSRSGHEERASESRNQAPRIQLRRGRKGGQRM